MNSLTGVRSIHAKGTKQSRKILLMVSMERTVLRYLWYRAELSRGQFPMTD